MLFALVFISEALDLPVWLVDPDFGEELDLEDWIVTLLDSIVQYILHALGVIVSPILRILC